MSVIKQMLKNEYAGDALLQKTIMMDFLTQKRVVNDGRVQHFYMENSRPAIITKEMFQAAQVKMARWSKLAGAKGSPSRSFFIQIIGGRFFLFDLSLH